MCYLLPLHGECMTVSLELEWAASFLPSVPCATVFVRHTLSFKHVIYGNCLETGIATSFYPLT